MSDALRARVVAFYLPQFHPIPENDEWWGKGFTEWTNVTKARPLFSGHYQPDLPSDLGFYDLRVPEVRKAQADLAREHGIEGFCYWHYWFGNGKRILNQVFDEVLESGEPDFPFCLGWANQTWSAIWQGESKRVLIEQKYPGEEDYRAHFHLMLKAFKDPRYICVDGKPLLVIYRPEELPRSKEVVAFWKKLAIQNGLPGLCVAAIVSSELDLEVYGYDMLIPHEPVRLRYLPGNSGGIDVRPHFPTRAWRKLKRSIGLSAPRLPTIYSYREQLELYLKQPPLGSKWFECVMPNWDNTPRCVNRGQVFINPDPELYRLALRKAVVDLSNRPREQRLIFLKSWNEWAEGNYVEPSIRFGRRFLQVTKEEVSKKLAQNETVNSYHSEPRKVAV